MSEREITRRRFLASGAAAGGAAMAASLPGWLRATAQAADRGVAHDFQAYETASKARLRYWWPGAYAEPAQVTREVNAMADAGFGGFEIADVRNAEPGPLPPQIYGWGSPRWKAAVTAALRAANARGLETDLTIGPYWPALSPCIKPDDEPAAKELTYGTSVLAGGSEFNAAVPPPHAPPSGSTRGPAVTVTPILLAVQAARIVGAADVDPIVLERASLLELTSRVAGGTLNWTAPAGGTWVIIASYYRGSAMIERQPYYEGDRDPFTYPQGYVVDHFGAAGSQAIIDWWEIDLLTPDMRTLLRRTRGEFFEDSLEFVTEQHFTPRMLTEFEGRRGYSLVPYLPIVQGASDPVFVFDDAAVAPRVRRDYDQTLSDLFIANHVVLLGAWARRLGMGFRNQPYGAPIDSALAAAHTGVPEGESLAFASAPDAFRLLAGGRDAGRRRILSDELGAQINGAYRLTWADLLSTANLNYGLGVNQTRIHGFPYLASPTNRWPGFYPWAPLSAPINFAEAWGPRQPQWLFAPEASAYMARTQRALQSGRNRADVAVYHGALDATSASYDGAALTAAGYSYQRVSWGILGLPTAYVGRGRLDPHGSAYKALVINAVPTMPLATAQRLLVLARAGLPIVLVGALPSHTPGYRNPAREDAALASVLADLVATPTVKRVATPADVPAALAAAGARGSAIPGTDATILHVRRQHRDAGYHYLHNAGTTAFAGTVSLEGEGQPLQIDAWTGGVTRLALYDDRSRGRIGVPVALAPSEATIIALAHHRSRDRHAVSSDGDVRYDGEILVARATSPGTVSAVLADGRTVQARITSVPAEPAIGAWDLTVTSWRAADPNATGPDAPVTTKTTTKRTLSTLQPWSQIPGLEDASGVGVYTTTIALPRSFPHRAGAYLDLGSVGAGTVGVRINGRSPGPVNQITRVVDLGSLLTAGTNSIEVTVTTTLFNAVKAMRPSDFALPRQDYGLIGPVALTPYIQAPLEPAGRG